MPILPILYMGGVSSHFTDKAKEVGPQNTKGAGSQDAKKQFLQVN
jgi:hypothetical protein